MALVDVRYAVRTLARRPGFATVAILSLALGIGANTAIYTVVRAVLLDPLAVPAPTHLFAVGWHSDGPRARGILQINSTSYRDERRGVSYSSNFSYSLYRALRQAGGSEVFGFSYAASDLRASFAGQPVVASGLLVSGNFLSTLGVSTQVGRPLGESDDRPGAAAVAVLSSAFWRRVLGADPSVVGRTIELDGSPFTVVGVTAPGFYGMSKGGPLFSPTDILLPLAAEPLVYTRSTPRALFDQDDHWWLQVMARVEPGAPATHLEAVLTAAFRSTLAASAGPALRSAGNGELRLLPAPRGIDSWTRAFREPLLILGIVAGVVLVIASLNVGNLLLVRASARQKELSIRLALGSSRWLLVRAILVEGLVLATAGGALGILIGIWGGRALLAMMIAGSTKTAFDVRMDGQLLAAAGIASVVAALVFSALPALRTARGPIAPLMKHVAAGPNTRWFSAGRVLMAGQVAISLPLLVGAALFLRTIHNLATVDLGFDPARLLMFHVDPSLNGYGANQVERLYGRLLERLEAIPGVDAATVTDVVLLSRLQDNWTFTVPGADPKNLKFARIGPAYFETFGIPTVAGRTIGVQDHSGAPRVAVVNEAAARILFGSGPALGRPLTMQSDPPAAFEIVGIVKDSRYTSPRDPMPPIVYLSYAQTTLGRLGPMTIAVRSSVAIPALTEAVRAAMADVDRNVPMTNLTTQKAQLDESVGTERTFMRLLLAFGAFALVLASIGLHGITAYSVVRRTNEIGVRIALGARDGEILRLVLRQVVGITVVGITIGVPAAVAAARLVRASLFGVAPFDPLSVIGAALVMLIVAASAGFFPARRAARLDPLVALRSE